MRIEARTGEYDFGYCVADLSDLDGDGWPELGIGIPRFLCGPRRDEADDGRGSVRIVSSRDGRVLADIRCPRARFLFGAAVAARAARPGEDGPVLLVTSMGRVESSASGDVAELFEFSTRTWEPARVRDLGGEGGQRLLVLRGKDGAQRIVTSRCDVDSAGDRGAVVILTDDPDARPILVTRESLLRSQPR